MGLFLARKLIELYKENKKYDENVDV